MDIDTEVGTLTQFKEMGRETVGEVNDTLNRYLGIAEEASEGVPIPHLSEYVVPQMFGLASRVIIDRYFRRVATGRIDAEHGYDEDTLTQTVIGEIKERTGAREI